MSSQPTTAALLSAIYLICYAQPEAWGTETIARHSIKLNSAAYEQARELIAAGKIVVDGKGAWREHQPSADEKNEFIRANGFAQYAMWHLGVDETHGEASKARYKFPYGDFNRLHRCALLAVKSRAHEYSHVEIERAADELLELMRARRMGVQSHRGYLGVLGSTGSLPVLFGRVAEKKFRRQAAGECRLAACAPQNAHETHALKNASTSSGRSSL